MKTEDVLKVAQKMELQGMEFYGEQKDRVRLPLLKDLFSLLSDMERGHAAYLGKHRRYFKLPGILQLHFVDEFLNEPSDP